MFRTRNVWGTVLGTLLILMIVGGGAYMAYQAGFAQGAISEGLFAPGSLSTAEGEQIVHRGYYPHWGFGFFGIGRLFFGFFFFFIFFGFLKRLLFFPMWGWRGRGYGPHRWKGPWGYGPEDEGKEEEEVPSTDKSV